MKQLKKLFIALPVLCAFAALLVLWLESRRESVVFHESFLPARITKEEVLGKIQQGSSYHDVTNSFGVALREIRSGGGDRLLTYMVVESAAVRPKSYVGFYVFVSDGKVTEIGFNRDEHSPEN